LLSFELVGKQLVASHEERVALIQRRIRSVRLKRSAPQYPFCDPSVLLERQVLREENVLLRLLDGFPRKTPLRALNSLLLELPVASQRLLRLPLRLPAAQLPQAQICFQRPLDLLQLRRQLLLVDPELAVVAELAVGDQAPLDGFLDLVGRQPVLPHRPALADVAPSQGGHGGRVSAPLFLSSAGEGLPCSRKKACTLEPGGYWPRAGALAVSALREWQHASSLATCCARCT